jgi:hypothetical protein
VGLVDLLDLVDVLDEARQLLEARPLVVDGIDRRRNIDLLLDR